MFDQYLQYAQEAKQKEIEINQKYDKTNVKKREQTDGPIFLKLF